MIMESSGFKSDASLEAELSRHDNITGSWANLLSELDRNEETFSTKERQVLLEPSSNNGTNASYINVDLGAGKRQQFIFCLAPWARTVADFWHMVWQQQTANIVMLTKGNRSDRYFPEPDDTTMKFENHLGGLTVLLLSSRDYEHFVVRQITLRRDGAEDQRQITHYHYTEWPDMSVPDDVPAFLNFYKHLRQNNAFSGCPIVHCAAGRGRTGTFAAIHSCFEALKSSDGDLKLQIVKDVILQMRQQRRGVVETPEQLRFIVATLCHLKTVVKIEQFEK